MANPPDNLEVFLINGQARARRIMYVREIAFQAVAYYQEQEPDDLFIGGFCRQPHSHVTAILSSQLYEGRGADVILVCESCIPEEDIVYQEFAPWLAAPSTPREIRGFVAETPLREEMSHAEVLDLVVHPSSRRIRPIPRSS